MVKQLLKMNRVVYSLCFVFLSIQLVHSVKELTGTDGAIYLYQWSDNLIGLGHHAQVLAGMKKNGNNFEHVALKFSSASNSYHERDIYEKIGSHRSIPKFYDLVPLRESDRVSDRVSDILIIELFGPNLKTLKQECGKKFSIKTTLMIGVKLLTILEHIHSKGVIYKDLKSANVAIGYDDPTNIYIFDFGAARAIEETTATRGNDIYDLGILMIDLLNALRKIPSEYTLRDLSPDLIQDIQNVISENFSESLGKTLIDFIVYADKLRAKDKPDYKYLKGLLFAELNLKPGTDIQRNEFDWLQRTIPRHVIPFEEALRTGNTNDPKMKEIIDKLQRGMSSGSSSGSSRKGKGKNT